MQQAILDLIDKHIYGLSVVNTEGEPQEEYHSEGQLSLMKLRKDVVALGDGWIPVTVIPEEGFYLTYNTIGAVFETFYHPHIGWTKGQSIQETDITHYQPLPNPPTL